MDSELDEKGLSVNPDNFYGHRLPGRASGPGLLSVLMCLSAFWVASDSAIGLAADAAPASEVTASQPLVKNLSGRLAFLGQFSAVDRVELRAQVGGTLTGIHFKDGQVVQKGSLLFSIDPVPYEIRLAQAKSQQQRAVARLEYAKSEYHRADELARSEAGSVQRMEQRRSEWRDAEAAVAEADAQIRDAQFDLDHCRILAPISGKMSSHLISVGNLIAGSRAAGSPTTLLSTIVSQDPVYLDFDMSESDYKLYQGRHVGNSQEKVQIAVDGGHEYKTDGVLDFIDNTLNRSSGTIHARATVRNAAGTLTPGEFARIRVITSSPGPTLLLPDAAILPDQSRFNILTVGKDEIVITKEVEVGEIRAGLRVIKSGLKADDLVIIGGLPFVAAGSKVIVKTGEIKYDDTQGGD